MDPNIRGATGREGQTDLKLENKSQCIKYKRDGGTTIEPESTKDTVGDQGFCGRLQKRICKSLEKVNEPEYMNTDRESQCIKYEGDVQLREATRKSRTGKVLRLAQQRISVYQIRKRCAARGGYKESAYRKGLEIGPTENLSVSNTKEM